jgi:hypothetical protein
MTRFLGGKWERISQAKVNSLRKKKPQKHEGVKYVGGVGLVEMSK